MATCETAGQCDPLCPVVEGALQTSGRIAAGVVMLACSERGGCVGGACPMQEQPDGQSMTQEEGEQ